MIKLFVFAFLAMASCKGEETSNKEKGPEAVTDLVNEAMVDSIGKAIAAGENKYSLDEIYLSYMSSELQSYLQQSHPAWSVPNQNLWYLYVVKTKWTRC